MDWKREPDQVLYLRALLPLSFSEGAWIETIRAWSRRSTSVLVAPPFRGGGFRNLARGPSQQSLSLRPLRRGGISYVIGIANDGFSGG